MKIAILIKKKNINNYENISFKKNAIKLNINFKIICEEDISVLVTDKEIKIFENGLVLNDINIIIPRTGSATTLKTATIIDAFAQKGILVLNNGKVITTMLDKFSTTKLLQENNIPIIDSLLVQTNQDLQIAIKEFKFPLIKKSNTGSLGKGIYLVRDQQQLQDLHDLSTLLDEKYYYILQKFIDYKIGQDVRVVMFNHTPIGIMKRLSGDGDFKANFTIHEKAEKIELTDEILSLCQRVMDIIGCNIAGIDLLETKNGYVVCEINSAPGFKGLESVNPGLNVAKEILKNTKKLYNEKK